MIFFNANCYTLNDRRPKVEGIVVENGRIAFIGSDSAVMKFRKRNTVLVDLHGATVVPGLIDSHCHLIGVGEREMTLNLEGTTSLEDFLARVRARVEQVPEGEWVTGRGWIETVWRQPVFPTRADLDRVGPTNPIFLTRADTHCAVCNSTALKIAGINSETTNPDGGEILREQHSEEPTGMLLDSAQELVIQHIPPPSRADIELAILLGAKRSVEHGWCQIHNAGSRYSEIELIRNLYEEAKLKLRIYNAVYAPGEDIKRFWDEGPTINAYQNRFTMRTVKILLDGSLGSRGAALLEPYSDADSSGFLRVQEKELLPLLNDALKNGIQIETHAIGDRANRFTLDLYETAFQAIPAGQRKIREPRWRVEHAQVLDLVDLPRFARLGVIPSMQPSHAIGDFAFAKSRLGTKRMAGAYAWRRLIDSGAIIAGGSDAPVEQGNPLIEFHAAVTRNKNKEDAWPDEQALSRQEALRMFTSWAAIAGFQEHDKGSIEVGKLGDLTVFSADIMTIPEEEILETRCLMTIIGGDIVHQVDAFGL